MPLYDMACDACLVIYEDMLVRVSERHSQKCECGEGLRPVPPAVSLIGPTDTQPYSMGGETFTSKAAMDAWQKKTGKHRISTSSPRYLRIKEGAYKAAENNYKKAGFDNREDFKRRRKQRAADIKA